MNNHEDLCNLAKKYIPEIVRSDDSIKMKNITFINLVNNLYTDTEWFDNARMQWKEFSYSKFPNFAGRNVNRENNTCYYQNKFYQMRVTRQHPSFLIFSILPHHPDDYYMEVTHN